MEVEIVETEFGVANTYKTKEGFRIELNKNLDEFPRLKEKVLEHERDHTRTEGFWKNRKLEFHSKVRFRELIPFFRKYPKTFLQQYSPIVYKDKTILIEWTLIFLYFSWGLIGGLIYFLITLLSKDFSQFMQIITYMFWIFMALVLLYLTGKSLRNQINEEANKLRITKK